MPDPFASMSYREQLAARFYRDTVYALQANVVNQMISQLNAATARTSKTLIAFIRLMEKAVSDELVSQVEEVNRQIASQAHNAILERYLESLIGTPTYRTNPLHEKNRRYAGGVLEGIIASSNFVTADADGIYVADVEALNAGARQWKRLNYGAGEAAGGEPGSVTVRWSDLEAFTLSEPGEARPGFMLPPGSWVGDEFYPTSELKGADNLEHIERRFGHLRDSRGSLLSSGVVARNRSWRPTRGIRGEHWLLAGLEVIADQLPELYGRMFKEFFAKADQSLREMIHQDSGLSRVTHLPSHSAGVTGGAGSLEGEFD
jgi:hypothetical protein